MKTKRNFGFKFIGIAVAAIVAVLLTVSVFAAETTPISEPLVVDGMPQKLNVGDKLEEGLLSVPEGAAYSVSYKWLCDGAPVDFGTTVEKGKIYTLEGRVNSKSGYVFTYDAYLKIMGDKQESHSFRDGYDIIGEFFTIIGFDVVYSTLDTINAVDFKFDMPTLNGTIPVIPTIDTEKLEYAYATLYYYSQEIKNNVVYDFATGMWSYFDEEKQDTVEFADNKIGKREYYFDFGLAAKGGYGFDENTSVTINGVDIRKYYNGDYYAEGKSLNVNIRFDYRDAIKDIELKVDEPKVGEEPKLPDLSGLVGLKMKDNSGWINIDTGMKLAAGEVIAAGAKYYLYMEFETEFGYMVPDHINVTINGDRVGCSWGSDNISFQTDAYNFGETVKKVEVTLEIPGIGGALKLPTIPENAPYVFSPSVRWYNGRTYEDAPAGTVVAKGDVFGINISVEAKTGYKFDENTTEVYLNGNLVKEYDCYMSDSWCEIYLDDIDFSEVLNEVKLEYAELEVGKPFPELKVPQDAKYALDYYAWYDLYTEEEVVGNVKAGGMYSVRANVTANDGYKFDKGLVVKVNGAEIELYEEYYVENYYVEFFRNFAFAKPIEKIELTIDEPKIGADITTVKVPSGANYKVDENVCWYDEVTGNQATGKFENGKRYHMEWIIKASEGYRFDDNTAVYINGTKVEEFYLSESGLTVAGDKKASFATKIDKVTVKVPEIKVGAKKATKKDIVLGVNVNYEMAMLHWNGPDDNEIKDKNRYNLIIELIPNDGYGFADDVVVEIEAKGNCEIETYSDEGYISISIAYSFNDLVNKIELPKLPEIKVGDRIPDSDIYTPDGKNYIYTYSWYEIRNSKFDIFPCDGDAVDGKCYLLLVEARPAGGYEFSEGAPVVVDGKEYTSMMLNENYDSYVFFRLYNFGKINVVDKVEITADIPEAGKVPGKVTLSDGSNCVLDDVYWFAGSEDLSEDAAKKDAWKGGDKAVLGLVVAAAKNYIISPDVVVTVNGKAIDLAKSVVYYSTSDIALTVDMGVVEEVKETPATGDLVSLETAVAVFFVSAVCALGAISLSKKRRFN